MILAFYLFIIILFQFLREDDRQYLHVYYLLVCNIHFFIVRYQKKNPFIYSFQLAADFLQLPMVHHFFQEKSASAMSTTCSAIANDAVQAGEGALRTFKVVPFNTLRSKT
jgi:hypothetical protein